MPSLLDNPAAAQSYLWAIILLPLAGALVNGLFGRRLGRGNAAFIALAMVGGSFALSLIAFSWAASGYTLRFTGDTWFRALAIYVPWGLLVDRLSGTMILVVTGVGFLIHIYSTGYMSHEDDMGFARFFTYLNLFIAAMLVLVLGDSLVLTFVGWEGVGLASYLLIGFWYTDPAKAYAGRKAFVTNRIGDFGFLLGVFSLLSIFGTVDYGRLSSLAQGVHPDWTLTTGVFAGWTLRGALTFATLGLFVGAAGKSAQLPLYVWLPDAMAGPTPVSALIHAATMVTAGVYLVARTSFLFALAPASMATVTLVGALTALFSAVIAFAQYDLKRILAYSTVSQLGFMFIGVGAGV
ncbi:MAG TPA: NADH-quinone oxidoreductase subunit L, partial [Anaeromyxobacteraceae bacterium]|nr:NADH-quinone oxidoreductase subunit L [Anaeromyxobacteraceae bacterium]